MLPSLAVVEKMKTLDRKNLRYGILGLPNIKDVSTLFPVLLGATMSMRKPLIGLGNSL